MYSIFESLLKSNNLRIADVSRSTGIPYSTFTDWKAGRYTPKSDKLRKIADYFCVPLEYLETGSMPAATSTDSSAFHISGMLLTHPELRDICEAYVRASTERQEIICDLLGVKKGEFSLSELEA